MMSQDNGQRADQLLAVMNFAGLRLAVPLAEVHSLVSVLDLDNSQAGASDVARVEVNGRELPAFGFDADLNTLRSVPDDYRVCANLGADSAELGILCESIETLQQPVSEEALPPCMYTDRSIVKGLALNNDEILLCTNLAALAEHTSTRVEPSVEHCLLSREAN